MISAIINFILLMKDIPLQLVTVKGLEINFREIFRKIRLVKLYISHWKKSFIVNGIFFLMKSTLSLDYLLGNSVKGSQKCTGRVLTYFQRRTKITLSLKSVVEILLKWPIITSTS